MFGGSGAQVKCAQFLNQRALVIAKTVAIIIRLQQALAFGSVELSQIVRRAFHNLPPVIRQCAQPAV